MSKISRYDQLRELFSKGSYFKLVCGAGNEDENEEEEDTCVIKQRILSSKD